MRFLRRPVLQKFWLSTRIAFRTTSLLEIQTFENFPSHFLNRAVRLTVFLPPHYVDLTDKQFPVLFFNDGQDMDAVALVETLENLYEQKKLKSIIIVAVHANENRIQEYGTAHQPDYKSRGAKAQIYTRFLVEELIPNLRRRYRCTTSGWAIAGFSLGGLSAFDIAWHHPHLFRKVGVFSGSFWWRSKPSRDSDPDAHRIVIDMLAEAPKNEGMKFWLQTGTNDETDDRNGNGIIDSIDDTMDVIKGLKNLGYQEGDDIKYVEVIGGEHNAHTWGRVLPDFLQWAFG